jgi:signal recognition particle receptor subunit beta
MGMKTLRLVVTGTVGAGKSTFVQTVSELGSIETDEIATDKIAALKRTTTVAFDFNRIQLNSQVVLHIYGTPGQVRFDFMWELLIQRAQAYILLVAAHRREEFHATREIIAFMQKQVEIPMVVGLTHTDCAGALSSEEVITGLGYGRSDRPPFVVVNPHQRASVFAALATSAVLLTPHWAGEQYIG